MSHKSILPNDKPSTPLSSVKELSQKRKTLRRVGLLICVCLLMALELLLSACTTLPQPPCLPVALPSAPALSEPPPSVSYSEQWRRLVERSLKKLTDMQAMPRP